MQKLPLIDFLLSHHLLHGYGFAVVIAVLLHILLFSFLTQELSGNNEPRVLLLPHTIKASVIEIAQPKQQLRKFPVKPVVNNATKKTELPVRRQRAIKTQEEPTIKNKQEKKQENRKKAVKQKERKHQKQLADEQSKKQQQAELFSHQQEHVEKKQTKPAVEAQAEKQISEVSYYSDVLRHLIAQNWNRPPSARNNMVTLVQLHFSDDGDLIELQVLEGSGNDAYDRSVIQAIQRAVQELKNLDWRTFNAPFKRINFRFKPEDLVR